MHRTIRAVSILLFLLASVPAAPAAPPASPKDERLALPVTCNAVGTDLGRLAKLITAETGVRIRVEKDIADEKLDVFVHDYPLGRLQRHLAALFGYHWSLAPGTEEKPVYVFWRDANTRKRQASLRATKEQRKEARLHEDLDSALKLLDLKDEDVEKLSGDDKFFAQLVRHDAAAWGYVAGLKDVGRDALFQDGLRVSMSDLPEDSPLLDMLLTDPMDKTKKDRNDFTDIAIELPGHANQTGMGKDRWLGVFLMQGKNFVEGRYFPLTADAIRQRPERPDTTLLKENLRGFADPDQKPDLSDPRLQKPLKRAKVRIRKYGTHAWEDDSEGLHAGLQRIADATGVPILSDYYTVPLPDTSLTGLKAAEAIERLCRNYGRTAAWSDGALLFRDNDWPDRMPKEIPLRVIEALERMATPKRPLTAEEASDPNRVDDAMMNLDQALLCAGSLTDEQMESLGAYGWTNAFWSRSAEMRGALRFAASLAPEQRARLEGPNGLQIAGLPEGPRAAFARLYEARWTAIGVAPAVYTARMERTVRDPNVKDFVSARFTFDIALPNETKKSELYVFPLAPDPRKR